jgi:squalene synthase HpnC
MVNAADALPLTPAYAVCARIARAHYENFPVASLLVPAAMRPHVSAVYAFARLADDFADEGDRGEPERISLLDAWLACLHGAEPAPPLPAESVHVFAALRATIRSCNLPVSLLEDLLDAFRQDVTTRRYASWADVLDYCRRSANPVGRLVLRIAGYHDEALDRSSDAVCTALQLTNFWQDLERDWQHGRLYVPLEDCRAAGADPADLDARRLTPPWREVLGLAAARTAALFDEGREVCSRVGGRLGVELRVTWLGGRRVLERLDQAGFDVFTRRPTLGAADAPVILGRLLAWRRA